MRDPDYSEERLRQLHALYCSLTMREIPLEWKHRLAWEHWMVRGWKEEDLVLVVGFIKRQVARDKRREESFRLHNLIDPARFADDLVDARAESHKKARRVDPNRAQVLRETAREDGTAGKPAETSSTVLERLSLAGKLREWREKNL